MKAEGAVGAEQNIPETRNRLRKATTQVLISIQDYGEHVCSNKKSPGIRFVPSAGDSVGLFARGAVGIHERYCVGDGSFGARSADSDPVVSSVADFQLELCVVAEFHAG